MEFRCISPSHETRKASCDNYPTQTFSEQTEVEDSIHHLFNEFKRKLDLDERIPKLFREKHIIFLKKGIENLSSSYSCLDASRPWLIYWILNSFQLLDFEIPEGIGVRIANLLEKCQSSTGGFGGGPGQMAHLAPTYAAVNSLCIVGTDYSLGIINNNTLKQFLYERHQPDGSFTMHDGGERDIRGVYCAATVAKLTNIMEPGMFDNSGEWLAECQTYEGGFAATPGLEAHGGYSFCGLASSILLKREKLIDITAFLRWLVNRQMSYEGGFQGRTNKLVDGCYSFWQGGAFPLVHVILNTKLKNNLPNGWLFDQRALQEYVLICCQHKDGGLIDKPGKNRDYYHTCYCLSGLSMAQNIGLACDEMGIDVIGPKTNNLLMPNHPIFNISYSAVRAAGNYFSTF